MKAERRGPHDVPFDSSSSHLEALATADYNARWLITGALLGHKGLADLVAGFGGVAFDNVMHIACLRVALLDNIANRVRTACCAQRPAITPRCPILKRRVRSDTRVAIASCSFLRENLFMSRFRLCVGLRQEMAAGDFVRKEASRVLGIQLSTMSAAAFLYFPRLRRCVGCS